MVIALSIVVSLVFFFVALVIIAKSQRPVPTTLRRELKKLPILRAPGTQRILALGGLATRRCERCVHWNLEQGQAAMMANPAFAQAAQHLTPAQMSLVSRGELNATDAPGAAGYIPSTLRWKDFGACSVDPQEGVVRHCDDSCEKWS